MKNIKEIKKEYNSLIENIPTYLEILKDELLIKKLEFDSTEVDNVEKWFKVTIANAKEEDKKDKIKKMFFSYCSQAFINSNGGELILDTNKKSFDYGLPIIVKYGGKDYPWVSCSIWAWMTRLIRGDFRGKLSETILRNLKDKSE